MEFPVVILKHYHQTDNRNVEIEVDGSVNEKSISLLMGVGVFIKKLDTNLIKYIIYKQGNFT